MKKHKYMKVMAQMGVVALYVVSILSASLSSWSYTPENEAFLAFPA